MAEMSTYEGRESARVSVCVRPLCAWKERSEEG